jgi:hypothetical protein
MNAVLRSESLWFKQIKNIHPGKLFTSAVLLLSLTTGTAVAGSREQAKQIHDRIAGVPPSESVLATMEAQVAGGDAEQAAFTAMEHTAFYDVTLKNLVMPWTNEEQTAFAPLNDYVSTIIGIVRDNIDFRQILSGDIIYTGNTSLGLPAYSNSNNNHYEELENQHISLKDNLVQQTQSSVTGLPANATAGVITSRASSRAFFIDGTNRSMYRFTMINHLCTDLEQIQDNARAHDRVRQDVSRSPGGDSRLFMNQCVSCHTGMDSLTGALAYYDYDYPDGNMDGGATVYNDVGETDPDTGTRVNRKYGQNSSVFKFGYQTVDDSWINYWRVGLNKNMGWDPALPGFGNGASSMGQELAHSEMFASCQVTKVFNNICLREPEDASDRNKIDSMVASFKSNNYNLKQVFAESAAYCMGN